jgi:hypothetical protein
MKLSEFKAWVSTAINSERPSKKLLENVKRNIEDVRLQKVTDDEGMVAVDYPIAEPQKDPLALLSERITVLEEKARVLDGRTISGLKKPPKAQTAEAATTDGEGESDGEETGGEETKKQEGMPAESGSKSLQAIAAEAIAAVARRLTDLQGMMASGTMTRENFEANWPNWDVKSFIESIVSIVGKAEEIQKLAGELSPKIDVLLGKTQEPSDAGKVEVEGEGKKEDAKEGEGEGEGEVDKTTTAAETQKGDGAASAFLGGRDLAPKSQGGAADLKLVRRGEKHTRVPGGANR